MCGCSGGAAPSGRGLVTSGDLHSGPISGPVPEEQARYRLVVGDETRYYATYRDAATAQATLGGLLRTAR